MSKSKLVALMLNASFWGRRDLVEETRLANDLCGSYLDYADIRSSLGELQTVTSEGKLNAAAYGALRNIAETQLSLGRGAFMVSPIEPDDYKVHLDGLALLADAYGVQLTVVEVKWQSGEDESETKVYLNEIPHLILPLGGYTRHHDKRSPAAISFPGPIQDFVRYFDRLPEFVAYGGDSIPDSALFRHFSHRHPLLLNTSDENRAEEADHCCSVCTASITGQPYYFCLCCSFFLHKQCAELPQHVKSPIHSHPMRLVIASWEKSGRRLFRYLHNSDRNPEFKIKCLICDSEERLPFYGCFYCPDSFVHHQCVCSLKHVIEHRLHPHPLTMETMKTNPSGHDYRCYACGSKGSRISYCCRECDFDFHLKCPFSLPPYVRHKSHKDHPLYLTMPPKDETNEYYCEVCAERRHPDYWIYLCKECEYEAHPHCVLQGIPGYTYKEEKEGDGDYDDDCDPEDDYDKLEVESMMNLIAMAKTMLWRMGATKTTLEDDPEEDDDEEEQEGDGDTDSDHEDDPGEDDDEEEQEGDGDIDSDNEDDPGEDDDEEEQEDDV